MNSPGESIEIIHPPYFHICSMICFHMFPYGYGSIPINTIFRGMNIHLPAILMFTRGTRFWHTAIFSHWFPRKKSPPSSPRRSSRPPAVPPRCCRCPARHPPRVGLNSWHLRRRRFRGSEHMGFFRMGFECRSSKDIWRILMNIGILEYWSGPYWKIYSGWWF